MSFMESNPSTLLSPLVLDSKPRITRVVVVFPAPSGPIKPYVSPGATCNESPLTALTPPAASSRVSCGQRRYGARVTSAGPVSCGMLPAWLVLGVSTTWKSAILAAALKPTPAGSARLMSTVVTGRP